IGTLAPKVAPPVSNVTVRLIDGRVLEADDVDQDGGRVRIKGNGWACNYPAYLLITNSTAEPANIQKVKITKDAIVTPQGGLKTFPELSAFLDKNATPSNPIVVSMTDVPLWSEARRGEANAIFGFGTCVRPDVGIEFGDAGHTPDTREAD
ncbi:MAG: hypothetical protein IT440_13150, partial [Phycisphaeraceae bacterium]|nr:hypothetical protein [Phycisphaeraceae bacterium]